MLIQSICVQKVHSVDFLDPGKPIKREMITIDCQKYKKPNDIDFENLDVNHLLQEEFYLIQKEP